MWESLYARAAQPADLRRAEPCRQRRQGRLTFCSRSASLLEIAVATPIAWAGGIAFGVIAGRCRCARGFPRPYCPPLSRCRWSCFIRSLSPGSGSAPARSGVRFPPAFFRSRCRPCSGCVRSIRLRVMAPRWARTAANPRPGGGAPRVACDHFGAATRHLARHHQRGAGRDAGLGRRARLSDHHHRALFNTGQVYLGILLALLIAGLANAALSLVERFYARRTVDQPVP